MILIGSYLFSVVEVVANHMVRFASHNTSQRMSRIACEYFCCSFHVFIRRFFRYSFVLFNLSFIPSISIVYSFVVSPVVPFLPLRLCCLKDPSISSIVYIHSFAISYAVVLSTYNFDRTHFDCC